GQTALSATGAGYRTGLSWRVYDSLAQAVDHRIGWDKLPRPAGLLVLVGLRNILRQKNLHDTTSERTAAPVLVPPLESENLVARTADGTYNDLQQPLMGARATRFGRNVPVANTLRDPDPLLLEPNPRTVSRELLTRKEFVPVAQLNLLASSWIQFMVKD